MLLFSMQDVSQTRIFSDFSSTFWSFILSKETSYKHFDGGQQKIGDLNMKRFKMPLIS